MKKMAIFTSARASGLKMRSDLSRANLSGVNVEGADASRSPMSFAHLKYSNLRGVMGLDKTLG